VLILVAETDQGDLGVERERTDENGGRVIGSMSVKMVSLGRWHGRGGVSVQRGRGQALYKSWESGIERLPGPLDWIQVPSTRRSWMS
jgi:hypothetical protein